VCLNRGISSLIMIKFDFDALKKLPTFQIYLYNQTNWMHVFTLLFIIQQLMVCSVQIAMLNLIGRVNKTKRMGLKFVFVFHILEDEKNLDIFYANFVIGQNVSIWIVTISQIIALIAENFKSQVLRVNFLMVAIWR
jgi:hypothetical protein